MKYALSDRPPGIRRLDHSNGNFENAVHSFEKILVIGGLITAAGCPGQSILNTCWAQLTQVIAATKIAAAVDVMPN